MNHVTHLLSSDDISIFSLEITKFCYIKKYRSRLHFDTKFLILLISILMMSAKVATLGLLKIKIFWSKSYDVIISVHHVTNKIFSCDSKDVVMWPNCGNITSTLKGFDQKNHFFFKRWSWFNFNNLGLALGMVLKSNNSVIKGLKLKVIKFWGLIPRFIEVTGETLVE